MKKLAIILITIAIGMAATVSSAGAGPLKPTVKLSGWQCSTSAGYKDSSYTVARCLTDTPPFTRGVIQAVQLCKTYPRDIIQKAAVKVASVARAARGWVVSESPRCGGTVEARWLESYLVPSYYP